MSSPARARAAKDEVLSLGVLAGAAHKEPAPASQFRVLVTHFLERFFTSELASADGDAKTRLVQMACALGIPGFVMALYLYPVYHLPRGHVGRYWGPRSYWAQAGDHYFYVLYALVAMGLVAIFEWDLFFPDLLDVFVLTPLPLRSLRMFSARVVAIFILIGAALFDSSVLAPLVLPAATDPPHLFRFLAAHVIAVAAAGIFGASFFLALQGSLLGILGDRWFRKISLWLQGVSVMLLLSLLFLYPLLFRVFPALMQSGKAWIAWLPPLWFLGIYQRLLDGRAALPVFIRLAHIGFAATAAAVGLAAVSYPLAWWRKTRGLIEGGARRKGPGLVAAPARQFVHRILARTPACRAIWQFIGQNLLRVPRYRMVLVMYGGAGAALVFATVMRAAIVRGQIRWSLSPEGLRAAVPMVAFLTVAGLRSTFLAPADQRGRWIFRVILGKPGWPHATATARWVLVRALLFTVGAALAACLAGGPALRSREAVAGQLLVAVALAVLLTDAFFLNVRTIPFTGARAQDETNFALLLIPFLGLFPALVLFTVAVEPWIEAGAAHLAVAASLAAAAHIVLARARRARIAEFVQRLDFEEDGDSFPITLGLRY
ncbi:MAG TPA: hypothetical protein VHX37_15965 [Acidobacteriaceae bacterium]|jgi:hypothetical protein|nr:hypothetical protein [Acidobacteriaceae bacterium]